MAIEIGPAHLFICAGFFVGGVMIGWGMTYKPDKVKEVAPSMVRGEEIDIPIDCVIPAGANGLGDPRFGKYQEIRTIRSRRGSPITVVCNKE